MGTGDIRKSINGNLLKGIPPHARQQGGEYENKHSLRERKLNKSGNHGLFFLRPTDTLPRRFQGNDAGCGNTITRFQRTADLGALTCAGDNLNRDGVKIAFITDKTTTC